MKKQVFHLIAVLIGLSLLSCYHPQPNANTKKTNNNAKETIVKPIVAKADTSFNFEQYTTGKSPLGWSAYLTGHGEPCRWEIRDDGGNKVLAQVSKETQDYRFNIMVNDKLMVKDVEITVKFKGVTGNNDQGGGPVWRFRDADNYYVVRANPLENNFRLYKVVNGDRHMLKSARINIETGKWYTIKVSTKGDKIKCYFDGKLALETTDDTFTQAGKTGLWTKSDAVTYFDDFNLRSLK
jgi:hypothetical protein